MIRPGRMRERITIQQMIETSNDLGEVERSYSTIKTVWAEVQARTSMERADNQRIEMQTAYYVKIRATDGIVATTRLLWKSKVLEVTSILERFDSSVLELSAIEVL